MPTIMWITEKELERVIVNKRDAGISLEEKHENLVAAVRKWEMLAASKERQWAAVKKTENDQEQQKCHTTIPPQKVCNQEVSRFSRANQR